MGDQIYSLEKYWMKNSSNKNIVFERKKCIKYIEYKFVNKLNENAFWYHEESDIMRIYFVECTNLFWLNKNIFWNPMTFIFGTFGLAVLLIDPNSMQNNISTLLPLLPLKNVYCCR